MAERIVTKQLGGVEDFLFGIDTVVQARGSGDKTITKINASHIPLIDAANLIAAGNVEAGLAELVGLINTNITNIAANSTSITGINSAGLDNGSFEIASAVDATLPSNWVIAEDTGGTIALDAANSFNGTQSLKFTSTGTGGGTADSVFLLTSPGLTHIIEFALKSSVADVRNDVDIRWYDEAKVYISSTSVYSDATTNPTAWTNKDGSVNAPATAAFFKVRLYGCNSADVTTGSTWFDGVNVDGKPVIDFKGADIASAAALTLGSTGNYFDVTGTTAITSINTKRVGARVKLHFDGILDFTHHATNLILPGGANITTAAGDEAELVEYDTGVWRCVNYSTASGNPVTGGSGVTGGDLHDHSGGDGAPIPQGGIADEAIGKAQIKSIGGTVSLAGVLPIATNVVITLTAYSFFPMIHTGVGSGTSSWTDFSLSGHPTDGASPDAPRFSINNSNTGDPGTYDVDYRYIPS